MKKNLLFSFSATFLVAKLFSQVTVSPAGGASAIASFLSGNGVTITNVVVTGSSNSIGYFTAVNTALNMPAGLALTSGDIANIPGPNNTTGASTANGTPGDPDLDTLSGGSTFDASVLEFDCVPTDDTLFFNYIFGSEEYPEFVSSYNDIFAIFISGPNLPFQNMAFVPSTNIPVCINNINNGMNNQGPCYNCNFYIDNTNDSLLQYDGTTTNLTAMIPVVPDSVYHFKIAIADALDEVFDSGVLLQAGSFRCANPNPAGISAVADESGIKMFPTPANGSVNFNFKNLANPDVEIVIHSLSGQEILSEKITAGANGNATLDLSHVAQGMYSVEIIADGVKTVKMLPVAGK